MYGLCLGERSCYPIRGIKTSVKQELGGFGEPPAGTSMLKFLLPTTVGPKPGSGPKGRQPKIPNETYVTKKASQGGPGMHALWTCVTRSPRALAVKRPALGNHWVGADSVGQDLVQCAGLCPTGN